MVISKRRIFLSVLAVALVAAHVVAAYAVFAASEAPQHLVYAVYDDSTAAERGYEWLRKADKDKAIEIDSYAVVSRDRKGKLSVKNQQHKGAAGGAITGAIIGLLGGPVGVVIGATAGGATGYLVGDQVGISREVVDDIKRSLPPGSSAVVAVVRVESPDKVRAGLEQGSTRVIDHPIAAGATSER
jgi:uncharacterized membrane protein